MEIRKQLCAGGHPLWLPFLQGLTDDQLAKLVTGSYTVDPLHEAALAGRRVSGPPRGAALASGGGGALDQLIPEARSIMLV